MKNKKIWVMLICLIFFSNIAISHMAVKVKNKTATAIKVTSPTPVVVSSAVSSASPKEYGKFVDVVIYPKAQTIKLGNIAEYKIIITDNHPIARCEPTETSNERCIIYYKYNLEVDGLPFDAIYAKSVEVYQGSSTTVPLTIKPTYTGTFRFTVKATLADDSNVYDSDYATLSVIEYRDCDSTCKARGYDYGVCRISCRDNEEDIGSEYCSFAVGVLESVAASVIEPVERVAVISATASALSVRELTSKKIVNTVSAERMDTETKKVDAEIYRRLEYRCCCGYRGIEVRAWTGKSIYKINESAKIYVKVQMSGNGDIDARVSGIVRRPDGMIDTLEFRRICRAYEIQKIKEENPSLEVSCIEDECWPKCIYVASYTNTNLRGYYSVNIKVDSDYGSGEETIGFTVIEDIKSCDSYCQELGYDYGVCRTSCRENERDFGSKHCVQPIIGVELADALNRNESYARYLRMHCCCGKLTPPPLPEEIIAINLSEGWNLITLPGRGKLSLGSCSSLYGFVYIDNAYLSMKKAREKLGEERLMEYLRRHSFWAYSFRECHLDFKLEEFTSYTELTLGNGWNFLPVTLDMVGKSLDEIKGTCDFQKAYYWSSKEQRWEILDLNKELSDEQKFSGLIAKVPDSCSMGDYEILSPPSFPE